MSEPSARQRDKEKETPQWRNDNRRVNASRTITRLLDQYLKERGSSLEEFEDVQAAKQRQALKLGGATDDLPDDPEAEPEEAPDEFADFYAARTAWYASRTLGHTIEDFEWPVTLRFQQLILAPADASDIRWLREEREAQAASTDGGQWWTHMPDEKYEEDLPNRYVVFWVAPDGSKHRLASLKIMFQPPEWGYEGGSPWTDDAPAAYVSGLVIDASNRFKRRFPHLAGAVHSLGPTLLDAANWSWTSEQGGLLLPEYVRLDTYQKPGKYPGDKDPRKLPLVYRQAGLVQQRQLTIPQQDGHDIVVRMFQRPVVKGLTSDTHILRISERRLLDDIPPRGLRLVYPGITESSMRGRSPVLKTVDASNTRTEALPAKFTPMPLIANPHLNRREMNVFGEWARCVLACFYSVDRDMNLIPTRNWARPSERRRMSDGAYRRLAFRAMRNIEHESPHAVAKALEQNPALARVWAIVNRCTSLPNQPETNLKPLDDQLYEALEATPLSTFAINLDYQEALHVLDSLERPVSKSSTNRLDSLLS